MTTEDAYVLNKRVRLKQPADGFRTGLDAVMLAAACPAKSGESVLDLGCGVGAAGLCVLTRVPGCTLTGIDIQGDHIDLARENAALNDIEGTEFQNGDIRDLKNGRFDHVICNPPYQDSGEHTASPFTAKATAHTHDEDTGLMDWIRSAHRNVKPAGSFTLIHRADKVDQILAGMNEKFGGVTIIPLWPKAGSAAKRVIIWGLRDRKSPTHIHPGIVLHQDSGEYTAAAETILRLGRSIPGL